MFPWLVTAVGFGWLMFACEATFYTAIRVDELLQLINIFVFYFSRGQFKNYKSTARFCLISTVVSI